MPGDRYPNLFVIGAVPLSPHAPAEVEAAVLQELRRLADEPVADRELQKARNQIKASFLYPLRSNEGLASQLSYFEIITGDWKNLNVYEQAITSVTAAQVLDAARRTFVASNRTVAVLSRPPAPAGPAGAAPASAPGNGW